MGGMKIGVIGTGNMGRTLGLRWAANGHEVLFGSRDRAKAEALARGHASVRAGDFDDAAAFGDVILFTARGTFPSALLRRPETLVGKVVIDCNNRDVGNDANPSEFRFDGAAPGRSLAEELAADIPQAKVVTAFNTIPHRVLELSREKLLPHRVSVFLCSDDADAKATVKSLVDELGFVGLDSGTLQHARLVANAADFIRFHIGPMGLGLFATLSIQVIPQ